MAPAKPVHAVLDSSVQAKPGSQTNCPPDPQITVVQGSSAISNGSLQQAFGPAPTCCNQYQLLPIPLLLQASTTI